MPGTVGLTFPTLVMPQTLCLAFNEAREYAQIRNEYHDGTPESGQLAQTSRHSFKLSRRLASSVLGTLRAFYVSLEGPLQPFIFYNPYDVIPVGSNYDPTGVNPNGRYVVAFRNSWAQNTNFSRTDVSNIELVELSVIDPTFLILSGIGPHGTVTSATLSIWATWAAGGGDGFGSPVVDIVYGTVNMQQVDFSVDRAGVPLTGISPTLAVYTAPLDPTKLATASVICTIVDTLFGTDTPPAELDIYDCYADIIHADLSTTRVRPSSTATSEGDSGGIFGSGVSGHVANPGLAIDLDSGPPVTFAGVTRASFNSLSSAGFLQLIF